MMSDPPDCRSGPPTLPSPPPSVDSGPPKVSKARKESEKHRSKTNRDEFKSIIRELNRCLGDTKMSTNKCLSTAISVIKLGKFFNCKSLGAMVDDEMNCSMESPEVLEELHCEIPMDLFMSTANWIGIGFEETGKILYVSQGFKDCFKFDECIIGCQLQTICFNADEVLRQVFIEDKLSFLFHVKSHHRREKKVISIYIDGKLLEADDSIKMFLGYGYGRAKMDSHDDVIIKNPMFLCSGCETWMSSDYQVIQGHPYLDMLLNQGAGSISSVDVFAYLHPDDIITLQKSQRIIGEEGYSRGVCRVLTREKVRRYLYVAFKAYAYIKVDSDEQPEHLYVCYVWPFAYSSDAQSYIDGGMQFIDSNKLWESKTPSFFKKPSNRNFDLKSQGFKRKAFDTSKHTVSEKINVNIPKVSVNKTIKMPHSILPLNSLPHPAELITPEMIKQELLENMSLSAVPVMTVNPTMVQTMAQPIPPPMFVISKPVSFAPVVKNEELPTEPSQQQIAELLQQLQRMQHSPGPSPHHSPPKLHPNNSVISNGSTEDLLQSLQQFQQQQLQRMYQQQSPRPSPQHSPPTRIAIARTPQHSGTPRHSPTPDMSEINRLHHIQQQLHQQLLQQQQQLEQQQQQLQRISPPVPKVSKKPTENLLESFRSTNPQLYTQLYDILNKPQSLIKVLDILQSMDLLSKPP